MKEISLFALALFVVGAVSAQFVEKSQSGFFDRKFQTVAEAKKMKDDAIVTMYGTIDKKIKHEKYQFSDDTGSMIVEIDDEDWKGVEVSPTDKIVISGEVDKDWWKMRETVEIDVNSIQK